MKLLRSYYSAAGLGIIGLVLLGGYFYTPPVSKVPALSKPVIHLWVGNDLRVISREAIPANLLLKSGIRLFPGDQVLADGVEVNPIEPLKGSLRILQVSTGKLVHVNDGGVTRSFSSSATNLGEALWQAGIPIDPADRISPDLSTSLSDGLQVEIQRAVPIRVEMQEQVIEGKSAAKTVGNILADLGLGLQGMDYAIPGENEALPANGTIRVVRVSEQVSLEQKVIPFKSQYQADPETELDQKSVIQPGETGLIVSRIRVRLEDGKEIARYREADWTARNPKDQLVGYGTRPVIHTETVDGVTIEYWRKLTAYATSYAPCEIYPDHCSYATASGIPLAKGVAAVIRSWYYQMRGQQIYVPGYGTAVIADIGGGVGGQNWIDLGYSDSDYVEWHQPVTVYFLTPVPANIPINLP
jgi:uncharacterized protein YabE (DUF348 family)